jgi:hypothetical protein
MKRFLINITLFALPACLITALAIIGTLAIARSASFKLPEDKTIVVVGSSHVCDGIDDAIFSRALNVSLEHMPYLIECAIARRFIKNNANIDKVIVAFDTDSVNQTGDLAALGDLATHIARFFFFVTQK